MKRIVIVSGILLTLLGCDKVVSEKQLPQRLEAQEVSCHYTGFCYDCSINTDGEYKCSHRLSSSCDGHQSATVRIKPKEVTYESGQKRIYEETQIVERKSQCQ